MKLERLDELQLEAAQGWLGLGNWAEASAELEKISPHVHEHPSVLQVRYRICEAANRWEMAAEIAERLCALAPASPCGWINLAEALHKLKRTQEAWDVLMRTKDKFPREYAFPLNLARYACQLGKLKDASVWLQKAFDVGDIVEVKQSALGNRELEPLWEEIADI